MGINRFFWISVLCWSSLAHLHANSVKFHNPQVRAAPEGHNSAAFVRIMNHGDDHLYLVKASSPVAKVVELHQSFEEEGIHKMRPVDQIEIRAGEETELKPGGLHIMLIQLTRDLKVNDEVPIKLTFQNGQTREIIFYVEKVIGSCH